MCEPGDERRREVSSTDETPEHPLVPGAPAEPEQRHGYGDLEKPKREARLDDGLEELRLEDDHQVGRLDGILVPTGAVPTRNDPGD